MRVEALVSPMLTLLLLACSSGAVAQAAPPPAMLLAQCAACHGERGVSTLIGVPSLAAQPKVFTETQLVLIREGLREVAAMQVVVKGMSDETVSALAAYFAVLPAPAPAALTQADKAKAGAALAQRLLCGTCHLSKYEGQQQVPRLAGQREDYLLPAMTHLRDNPGPGRDTIMAATLRGLSDADLGALAHHLATFKP